MSEKEESSGVAPRSTGPWKQDVINGIDGEIAPAVMMVRSRVSGALTVGDAVGEIDLAIPVS